MWWIWEWEEILNRLVGKGKAVMKVRDDGEEHWIEAVKAGLDDRPATRDLEFVAVLILGREGSKIVEAM